MNKKNIVLHIATPFLLALVSVGILIVAMIKPADKLKVFVNIAFMDSLKSDPASDNTGLVIRENEIKSDYQGETSETGEVIRPKFGELYATLNSDVIGLDIPVYWGSNSELLERGACHSSSSVIVGTEGNSVISAHVDTFFADLDKLKEGDIVTVRTNYGEFEYKVRETISFSSSSKKYITPKDDNRLTLYTCKRDLLGASDQRIGVICDLAESRFYAEKEDE
ncbi:MAG: class D sortase [Ruminococcus flavefaciens]|nr:class D sortase [Ruminococcus flavefaciens]MCM1231616.1 class D sortase [Ruminococcus flavefaciens]